MPDPTWSSSLYATLNSIRDLGYDVVIAHVDRYGKKEAEELIKRGFRVQLNADSVCAFGTSRLCSSWAKNGYVYALGSDTHIRSAGVPSYKKMVKAVSVLSAEASSINDRMHELIGKE